jgi:hypothetical protein
VSVLFVAYIPVSVGMASRPLGHGSASPAGPLFTAFDAVASLRPAHGAELLHTISVEANAWAGDVGVERVNSRSSPGVLAVRTRDVTLHGALTEEYPVPLLSLSEKMHLLCSNLPTILSIRVRPLWFCRSQYPIF